jgi:3-oxoacyl-[acyl-carrier-protein] synthase-3
VRVDWPLRIAGLGHAVPSRVVSNAELALRFDRSPEAIHEMTGVIERRRCDLAAGESAIALGVAAARQAIERAGIEPRDVDLVLNASGTQEQAIPDGAALLQRDLGLGDSGVASMSVHTTCLSFLSAIEVAGALMQAGLHRRVLVISAEAASEGLDPNDVETNALIGDAGAAAVLELAPTERSRLHAVHFETYGESADLTTVRGGGTRRAPLARHTKPDDNFFRMEGLGLLKVALRRLPPFLERVWPGHDLRDVDHVVPHQASRAAFSVLERLGFAPERLHRSIAELGNCVAASIPSTLFRAVERGAIARGDRVLLLGSGAGVSFGAAVLTY